METKNNKKVCNNLLDAILTFSDKNIIELPSNSNLIQIKSKVQSLKLKGKAFKN